jgi:hypothetical protein
MEIEDGGFPGPGESTQSSPPLMEQAKQKTQEVVHLTQQKAGEAMGQASEQIKHRIEETKSTAAENLSGVAQAIRSSSQHMREQPDAPPTAQKVATYADSAAEVVEHVSGYLRDKNIDQVVTEVEGFARRQPAVYLGSALALGFLAARFLKSSNPNAMAQPTVRGQEPRLLPSFRSPSSGPAEEMRSSYDPAPTAS